MIDLHLHSTCSDGTCTPAELVELAVAEGLSAAALTDHDTMEGVPEFVAAARGRIRAIPGVELSAEDDRGPVHILAYFPDPVTTFEPTLHAQRADRESRNREILKRLDGWGLPLTYEEVRACAAGGVVARPHIADALVRRGHVADPATAFDRWIGDGKPAYVARRALTPDMCVRAVREAGGISVLAHPATLGGSLPEQHRRVRELADAGLDGLEVYYPTHTPAQTRRYRAWARELGLAPSGGTDFHGARRPGIRVGRGGGRFRVPSSCLDDLERRLQARLEAIHSRSGRK